MTIDYHKIDLPVKEIVPETLSILSNEPTLVVNAPAGAGKSTLLPLVFLDQSWLGDQKIIMLEPRRLAAKAIAGRMSYFLGEKVGETIGYRIRFETAVSTKTKIEVVTEGILTRMIQSDNELNGIAMVIFDEFHERSLHADLALALCRESQQVLRPDLKILIMSATLDMPSLTQLLQCRAVQSEGRLFPVEIEYAGEVDVYAIPEFASRTIINAVKQYPEGDILVFLPGQGEILRTKDLLEGKLSKTQILPLYGSLPINKQQAAISPSKKGIRKIVLSTSIAETSLTIEGVTVVIDCGFSRISRFDPKSGLSGLETVKVSKAEADQRAGRAGRVRPGNCIRMWSKARHEYLNDHLQPEILEADLSSLMLELAQWGIEDISQLTWLTQPPKKAVYAARELLEELEATELGKITSHGKEMNHLPCHPRIAHMLLMAKDMEMLPLASDLAAILEERDPLGQEAGVDINLRVEALRRYRQENRRGGKLNRIQKISQTYLSIFEEKEDNESVDPYETGILLTFAYPERIAHARPGNNAQFQLANGKIAKANHKDDLAYEPWLAIAQVDDREGIGKIFLASPLNPKDLAPMVKEKKTIKWDKDSGGLNASIDLRIGNIILQSKPWSDPDPKLVIQTLLEIIEKDGFSILNFDESFTQWQNRIQSLRKWNDNEDWPDLSTEHLLETCSTWLTPYLSDIRTISQLQKIDLKKALDFFLTYDAKEKLKQLAPEKIPVPSGSQIILNYKADGSSPIMAVRIQEIFGMKNTPSINAGKTQVLMHLLSPGFKPVQITNDLASFWENTYFEVKKDLKRRYPKHAWPDDPLNEPPIRGVKRKS